MTEWTLKGGKIKGLWLVVFSHGAVEGSKWWASSGRR